jgi:Ca-activated chloride channel family protein
MFLWSTAAVCVAKEPPASEMVRRGNAALRAGKYDEAMKAYKQAEVSQPESPQLKYNQGLIQYRQRDFAKARDLFGQALSTRDLDLEARAHFNLGDCAYSQALEKLKSYDEAIKLAREAIGYYRQALELKPDDRDARANIETAQLLIKDLQDRKKKEEEEKKKQPQSQPSSQPQSQPSSQPQSRPQSQPSSQPQSQPSSQPQQQPKEGQDKKEQQEQPQQQSGAEQRKMSPEQADRLLQAVRDKERQRRENQAQRQNVGRIMIDKDW